MITIRDHLLTHLPVGELITWFSRQHGRPTKDFHTVLGTLILQQLHDLTDAATVEAVAFNITWHYALDIRAVSDAYLCERTLRNYRQLLIEKELDQVLFRSLTDCLIKAVGTDTGKQRLDSTAIRSAMRADPSRDHRQVDQQVPPRASPPASGVARPG